MSQYIIAQGKTLSEVFERAASAQPAQFCGYWANIDFWLSELEHFVSITNGYEGRVRIMRDAYDRYIAAEGGSHNLDEFGVPYQGVWETTTVGDRRRIVGRARSAFVRVAQRGVELGLIDWDGYADLIQRLKRAEAASPNDGPPTPTADSGTTEGSPPVS